MYQPKLLVCNLEFPQTVSAGLNWSISWLKSKKTFSKNTGKIFGEVAAET